MASISLPSCLLLALSFLVTGVPARYSPGDYKPDIGEGPPTDYGRPVKPNCHLEQKTIFDDRCEGYDEKTCWTQNEEFDDLCDSIENSRKVEAAAMTDMGDAAETPEVGDNVLGEIDDFLEDKSDSATLEHNNPCA